MTRSSPEATLESGKRLDPAPRDEAELAHRDAGAEAPAAPVTSSSETGSEPPFLPLHPNALQVALWSGAIRFVVGIGVFAIPWLLSLLGGLTAFLIASALWLTAFAVIGFLALYWPRVRLRHVSYRVTERGLEIRRGVLWRSHQFLARSRIQHTDVAQGPLQRRLDLARLIVYTAGTHYASTSLSGIHYQEAERIRRVLTADDGDEDGV